MRKLVIVALAAIAVTALSNTDSMAQTYQNSYRFGVGLGYGTNFRHGPGNRPGYGNGSGYGNFGGLGIPWNAGALIERAEAPPFFAQYPPVYYNGITSRPYGISPYAAPPGITPIEMGVVLPPPQTIHNPFFDKEVAPVSDPSEPVESADNKTTHIVNPYSGSVAKN